MIILSSLFDATWGTTPQPWSKWCHQAVEQHRLVSPSPFFSEASFWVEKPAGATLADAGQFAEQLQCNLGKTVG